MSTSSKSQTVLFVLSSHSELGNTGRETGWYLPEAAHPWQILTEHGVEVAFVSPNGGRNRFDGFDANDPVQKEFLSVFGETGPMTMTPAEIDAAEYDAVLFIGGHGVMWDFADNTQLASIATSIYESNGLVAAVCHGPAGLVNIMLSDGTYLVNGKRLAAFTNDEEAAVGLTDVVPFLLADALVEHGAIHVPVANFEANVVVDGRLITGQNPASATGVADALVVGLAAALR